MKQSQDCLRGFDDTKPIFVWAKTLARGSATSSGRSSARQSDMAEGPTLLRMLLMYGRPGQYWRAIKRQRGVGRKAQP